jgi:hypothetical protein
MRERRVNGLSNPATSPWVPRRPWGVTSLIEFVGEGGPNWSHLRYFALGVIRYATFFQAVIDNVHPLQLESRVQSATPLAEDARGPQRPMSINCGDTCIASR